MYTFLNYEGSCRNRWKIHSAFYWLCWQKSTGEFWLYSALIICQSRCHSCSSRQSFISRTLCCHGMEIYWKVVACILWWYHLRNFVLLCSIYCCILGVDPISKFYACLPNSCHTISAFDAQPVVLPGKMITTVQT